MDFISKILLASLKVIEGMARGLNVLIHCSDGWDRTSQVSSLVQLIIDPYFRTFDGFLTLVEKEWRVAGYRFKTRHGIGEYGKHADEERSPIFVLFLDCVHQLFIQNFESFEFNIHYLVDMAHHLYTGVYGNFLENNEKVLTLPLSSKNSLRLMIIKCPFALGFGFLGF